uniref:Uncharacterized protein n=1 Tax=viral metagenome TaxID=1070528 RepID=A0A6C0CSE9_9ZZZZ
MLEYRDYLILQTDDIETALYYIFKSKETLDQIHGVGNYSTPEWEGNQRKIKYTLPLDYVPEIFQFLIGGEQIKAKAKFAIEYTENGAIVPIKIIPKIIGSSLIKIKPIYIFTKQSNKTIKMELYFKIKIYLPDDLQQKTESFILLRMKEHIQNLKKSLEKQKILIF